MHPNKERVHLTISELSCVWTLSTPASALVLAIVAVAAAAPAAGGYPALNYNGGRIFHPTTWT